MTASGSETSPEIEKSCALTAVGGSPDATRYPRAALISARRVAGVRLRKERHSFVKEASPLPVTSNSTSEIRSLRPAASTYPSSNEVRILQASLANRCQDRLNVVRKCGLSAACETKSRMVCGNKALA